MGHVYNQRNQFNPYNTFEQNYDYKYHKISPISSGGEDFKIKFTQ